MKLPLIIIRVFLGFPWHVLGTLERTKTISERTITTRELGRYLRECGYTNRRLQKNYTYSDSSGKYTVPLVGFAYETFDARNACIAGLDVNSESVEQLRALVGSHRGLGAPVVFACRQRELQWWSLTVQGPEFKEIVSADHAANFFDQHRKQFFPRTVYLAKTRGRLDSQCQLSFVDVGLMPIIEEKMGEELAKLMGRVLDTIHSELGKPSVDVQLGQWLFRYAFWLLGAKILKDKQVTEFSGLDLEDISETLRKVHNHYNIEQALGEMDESRRRALAAAATIAKHFSSLANLTVESLAYVYENTLITKEIRKALGIHATPPYLVDYIVWQLAPWIEQISQANRVVLEPTCGHAPFLVSAARLLREMIDEQNPKKRHNYLKDRLLGLEVDSFASEIARLSLTLTDVPNPNGWRLESANVFTGQALSNAASQSTILLCNPPFENFTPAEKADHARSGASLRYGNKAAEVLAKTLPYMPAQSVFGVIVPRGFLHRADLRDLRKLIASEFDLQQICELPDNVFAWAKHESVVLLGQKRTTGRNTTIVRVKKWDLDRFRQRYDAPGEVIPQTRLQNQPNYDFLVPQLEAVWHLCESLPSLETVAKIGKGLEYKGKGKLPPSANTISVNRFPGAVHGYSNFDPDIKLTERPKLIWMSLSREVIRRPGLGTELRTPQVLLNYAPISQEPWRLKALIDGEGRAVTSRFVVIRPRKQEWPLETLWAILNSPLANAYIYTRGTKRDVLVKLVKRIPMPDTTPGSLAYLENLVRDYFKLVSQPEQPFRPEINKEQTKGLMLAIDAEVMRLYDLPPRLERELLDLFDGWERKGIDFKFTGYFPRDFESRIPLHEYLSDEFQRSTVSFVRRWVEKAISPEVIKAFETATETFRED